MPSKTIFLVIRRRKVVVVFLIMQSLVVNQLFIIIRQLPSPGGVSQLVRGSGMEWQKGTRLRVTKRISWFRFSRSVFPEIYRLFFLSQSEGIQSTPCPIARPSHRHPHAPHQYHYRRPQPCPRPSLPARPLALRAVSLPCRSFKK